MIYTATEARQKFFELLKFAEKGIPVTIIHQLTGMRFGVSVRKEPPVNKEKRQKSGTIAHA